MGKLIGKLKVLIVDDEHLIRNLLRMRIDWVAQGMEIVGEAANAEEAMVLVEQLQPDIIFTDIYMPKIDGIEFSEQVLAIFPHIKIVIVTGHDEFEYARRSIKIGVFEFILKPIRPAELLQVTSKLRQKIEKERLDQYKMEQLQEVMDTSYQSDPKMLEQLQFHISIGDSEQAIKQLQTIFDSAIISVAQFRMVAIDIIMECQRAAIEQQLQSEVVFDRQMIGAILSANQLAELLTALQAYVREVADSICDKLQPQENNLIHQVKTYLETHLSNADLGLASTAAHFYVSPGHLGRLMKKETGQTFVEYLTQIRMKKAELLLKQTDLRGYEIGEKVGIPDPHYFSVLFKKSIGRSMNEYRSVRNFK